MKVPEPRRLPSGRWFIYLRLGGEKIPITTATRRECVSQAQTIKAEYLAGREVKKKTLPPAPDRTLRELIDGYIKKYKPVLSPATVRGYCVIRDNRFPDYMDQKVREIADWQRMINAETQRCAPKTLKSAWSLVHAALKDAGQTPPPVKLPQIAGSERPFLTSDEILRLVDAVHGTAWEIPVLLGLHGLRRSEIAALEWKQIDLQQGVIRVEGALVPNEDGKYVRKQTTKSDAGRRKVRIVIPQLQAALEAMPESDRSGAVVKAHINSLYKAVNAICERNGLPKVGAHGLRHSYASLGHFVGVPAHEMQIQGGWKDPATMRKIYEHIEQQALSRAENAMADFFKSGGKKQENANANANEAKND